jgi:transposase
VTRYGRLRLLERALSHLLSHRLLSLWPTFSHLLPLPTDETTKSAWCRSNGIHVHDLIAWRQSAINALSDARPAVATASGLQSQSKEDRLRIQELERDLKRKNSALAETAALLVLSKEMAVIFRKGEDE